jgi:glycine/serine hydroxymethyltransferase
MSENSPLPLVNGVDVEGEKLSVSRLFHLLLIASENPSQRFVVERWEKMLSEKYSNTATVN